jgi:hypothetical protein
LPKHKDKDWNGRSSLERIADASRLHRERVSTLLSTRAKAHQGSEHRRTAAYRAARDAALFAPMYRRGSFSVVLSLDDALGPDYLRLVEGVRRADGRIVGVDFEGGLLLAIFRLEPSGAPVLVTMYPVGR